jgi:large subunit ribosomal protein L19e
MNLQKINAAKVMKCSPKRVRFDAEKLAEIKEAITKHDIRLLVGKGVISAVPKRGVSRARANVTLVQKRKGNRQGPGSRKGCSNARDNMKDSWIGRIRKQRKLIKQLYASKKIGVAMYHDLYKKAKGNFFRSTRHIKTYLEEHGVLKENERKY